MIRRPVVYRTRNGTEPFWDFVNALKDRVGAQRLKTRVLRAARGNLGDHRAISSGVIELRLDFGPGYRIYVGLVGLAVIVLLCAGDKGSQGADIRRALVYWRDYRRST